jgi:hypothetical protein
MKGSRRPAALGVPVRASSAVAADDPPASQVPAVSIDPTSNAVHPPGRTPGPKNACAALQAISETSVVQSTTTEQFADATATASLSGVSNENSWESRLGAVDALLVTQENVSVSIANADNSSEASQSADNSQWAVAPVTESPSAPSDGEGPLPLSVAGAGASVPGSPGVTATLTGGWRARAWE